MTRNVETPKLSKEEAAYFAGLLEGEGNLTIIRFQPEDRPSPTYMSRLSIGMKDKEPVKAMSDFWGSPVHEMNNKYNPGQCYTLCPAKKTTDVLRILSPYFRSKRKQMESLFLLAFRTTVTENKWSKSHPLSEDIITFRDSLWRAIRILKR